MSISITLSDVSCHYDDEPLFAEISSTLSPGSLVHLTGPNGAGKTTLLRCIAGLSSAYHGQIAYTKDSSPMSFDYIASSVCYLGHKAGIKPELTAVENLQWLTDFEYDDSELLAALERVGLFGYEYQPCNTLSAGQRQRVALARLFLQNVSIYILDEPFTALDVIAVQNIESQLIELSRSGALVLFTSHQAFGGGEAIQLQLDKGFQSEAS